MDKIKDLRSLSKKNIHTNFVDLSSKGHSIHEHLKVEKKTEDMLEALRENLQQKVRDKEATIFHEMIYDNGKRFSYN